MMTRDQERWAEALTIDRRHGPQAPAVIAQRIATLGAVGDAAGVERWTEIAERFVQLREPTVRPRV